MTNEAPIEIAPDNPPRGARPRLSYLQQLSLRREAAAIRRHIVYGLVMGWILCLFGGFMFFCVPSHFDWLWAALAVLGFLHLAAAVVVPQALQWPERVWTAIARWQGWLVMTLLLTIVYFAFIWPASYFSRRRTRGFVSWQNHPRELTSSWQPIDLSESGSASTASGAYRSLPVVLASVIGFFFRRGDILLVLIVIFLVVLGLALYFVESTALAPFIYTLF